MKPILRQLADLHRQRAKELDEEQDKIDFRLFLAEVKAAHDAIWSASIKNLTPRTERCPESTSHSVTTLPASDSTKKIEKFQPAIQTTA
jgi:hypothetical protein